MKKITKHVFVTSDGKPFDIKVDAEKHEAGLDLVQFFLGTKHFHGLEQEAKDAVSAILDNLDDFAEIIRPLIRKPRGARAEAQADDYEAEMKGRAA
jgi:hypothetical protein